MASQTRRRAGIEVDKIRQDFPMLRRSIHGRPLLDLDNAGSSLKLRSVLDRHGDFYESEYANTNEENSVGQNATKAVGDVRSSIANLLGRTARKRSFPSQRYRGDQPFRVRIRTLPASAGR